jgi:hypothetical protein
LTRQSSTRVILPKLVSPLFSSRSFVTHRRKIMEQPTSREGSVETVSRISIGHFVKECKRHTANAISHQEKTTLVIGNESAGMLAHVPL